METFIALIALSASVLQIILFFKLWGMTNDVNKIKKTISEPTLDDIRAAILKGDKEKTKSILVDSLIKDLIDLKNGNSSYGEVNQIINVHKNRFEKTGVEMPEFTKKINNVRDIIDLI